MSIKSMPNCFCQNKVFDAINGNVQYAKVLKAFIMKILGISPKTELKFKKTDIVQQQWQAEPHTRNQMTEMHLQNPTAEA